MAAARGYATTSRGRDGVAENSGVSDPRFFPYLEVATQIYSTEIEPQAHFHLCLEKSIIDIVELNFV